MTVVAALTGLGGGDYEDFFIRLSMDLVAAMAVTAALFLRRHHRRDLFLVFTTFNLGVFGVLAIITEHKISAAVGFGLFALLSIIRLRSEPFANVDLGYFFASLVLGVVNGIGHGDRLFNGVIDLIVVAAMFALDHPRIQRSIQRRRVTLDAVHTDPAELRAELERRFGVEIVELRIGEIDYVRETTSVSIRYIERAHPRTGGLVAVDEGVD